MMGLKDIPEIYEGENFQNFISLQNGSEFMDNLNKDVKELEKYDLLQTYSEKFSYYKSEITNLVSTLTLKKMSFTIAIFYCISWNGI